MEGKRIILRTVKKADLEELDSITDDWKIMSLTGSVHPNTEKELADGIERCQDTESRIWFVIVDKQTNKIIGETGFLRIFMPWRTSDFTLEIWNKDYWGKGIGKEVSDLMFEYGFNYLNLHRLAIGVVEKNEKAIKFWKKIGFIEEGKQIQGFFSEGVYSDFIMMYYLEDHYRANKSQSQI